MNRLKVLREELNKTQKEIAAFLGITTPAYNYYENSKRDMSTETITKLANYYNVSVDYLLGKSDIRNSKADFDSDLLKIGLSMKEYQPPTEEQKKQIEDFAKYVLKDNKK
jgi:transcriptional regulator with XRE-family HTH domain